MTDNLVDQVKEALEKVPEIRERARKFNLMQLPGQGMGMHMGTSYLVNDLDRLVALLPDMARALIAQNERLKVAKTAIDTLAPMLDDDPSLEEQKAGRAALAAYRALKETPNE